MAGLLVMGLPFGRLWLHYTNLSKLTYKLLEDLLLGFASSFTENGISQS